jgi:hypothetical protein
MAAGLHVSPISPLSSPLSLLSSLSSASGHPLCLRLPCSPRRAATGKLLEEGRLLPCRTAAGKPPPPSFVRSADAATPAASPPLLFVRAWKGSFAGRQGVEAARDLSWRAKESGGGATSERG